MRSQNERKVAVKHKKKPQWISHTVAMLFAVACIIPFIIVISSSFTNEFALSEYGYQIWPTVFDTTAYEYIFRNPEMILKSYGVTIITTVATTVLGVLFMAMIAYPLSRRNCKFRRPLSFYVFFTMLFSGGLVPSYILMTQYLHLKDNILVLIIPSLINAFYVIMIRTFFQRLPESLFESAKIDGASEFRIFFSIAIPLSVPVLASVAFFTAMGKWNDWYTAMLYINDQDLVPLQYMLYRIQNNLQVLLSAMTNVSGIVVDPHDLPGNNLIMAMAVVATGPMMFVFPFFQKYFVQGLTVGAVKG